MTQYRYSKEEILTNITQIEAKLSEYNIIIAIDGSGSMGEPVRAGQRGPSRWESVQETAMSIIRDAEKIDEDGIGLVFFAGQEARGQDNVTSDVARQLFASRGPRGSTPLTEGLIECLKLAQSSSKKVLVVVFTDGIPNDKASAAKLIVDASNLQHTDDGLTFLFVQVGDDAGATAYLRSLDDDLKSAKFDIVDVKTVQEAEKFATTAELLYNAIID